MSTYLLINGRQQGPYSLDQVRGLLSQSVIRDDCLAWNAGLPEWRPLHSILTTWRERQAPNRVGSLTSGMGIMALIIGASGILGWPLLLLLAGLLQSEAFLTVLGLLILGGMGMNLVGTVMALVTLFTASASKPVPIIGLCLNALELLGMVFVLVLGMMLESSG